MDTSPYYAHTANKARTFTQRSEKILSPKIITSFTLVRRCRDPFLQQPDVLFNFYSPVPKSRFSQYASPHVKQDACSLDTRREGENPSASCCMETSMPHHQSAAVTIRSHHARIFDYHSFKLRSSLKLPSGFCETSDLGSK